MGPYSCVVDGINGNLMIFVGSILVEVMVIGILPPSRRCSDAVGSGALRHWVTTLCSSVAGDTAVVVYVARLCTTRIAVE